MPAGKLLIKKETIDDFVTGDSTQIKWSPSLKQRLIQGKSLTWDPQKIVTCHYRPFEKSYLYFSRELNARVAQIPQIFPQGFQGSGGGNRVIAVSGRGCKSGFSALMLDCVPNLHTISEGQCFPLYWYPQGLASEKRPALSFKTLKLIQAYYSVEDSTLSHTDVFYYLYGLFHHPTYTLRYAHNLSKDIPRIPLVHGYQRFQALVTAGKELGDLHVNYEKAPVFQGLLYEDKKAHQLSIYSPEELEKHYRVTKMKFGKTAKGGKDKKVIIYNPSLSISGIPSEAYDYQVNGKSPVEWVMDRWRVKADKDSGLVKDSNDWGVHTRKNPRYILELIGRVVTVSLETQKKIQSLPEISWDNSFPSGSAEEASPSISGSRLMNKVA